MPVAMLSHNLKGEERQGLYAIEIVQEILFLKESQASVPGSLNSLLVLRISMNELMQTLDWKLVASAGIRVPDNDFIQKLCQAFGGAIALTSANLSGGNNSLEVGDFEELWPQCGVIYNGGAIRASPLGSTIIDLSLPDFYKILRPGIAEAESREVLEKYSLCQRQ